MGNFTWISSIRLWPLKAKAMIPSALRISKILITSDLPFTGLYDTPGILPSTTEITQIRVQYAIAVMAPTSDTPAIEFKLGSWDRSTAAEVNIKYHSVLVGGWAEHVPPHTVLKNSLQDWAPMMIKAMHVPADRYKMGNNANHFANFSPELLTMNEH